MTTEQSRYKLCVCIYIIINIYIYIIFTSVPQSYPCIALSTSTERNPVPASRRSMFGKSQLSKCKRGGISARGKHQRVNYMLECPSLQDFSCWVFRITAFTWPWETGLWERELWAGLCCLLALAVSVSSSWVSWGGMEDYLVPGAGGDDRESPVADGAGGSQSWASLAAVPFFYANSDAAG